MKKLLLLLFTFISICLFAQNTETQNIIYLKNGSKIKAKILSLIPNEKVEIQTFDGSIYVYQMSEVEKIEQIIKSSAKTSTENVNKERKSEQKKSGYVITPEIGVLLSIDWKTEYINGGIGNLRGFHLSLTNSYQFNEHFTLGALIGLRFFGDDHKELAFLADFRYTPLKKDISPLFILNGGYTQILNSIGTAEIGGGIGVRKYLKHNIAFNLYVDYSYRGIYDEDLRRILGKNETDYYFLSLKAGFTF